MTSVLTSRFSRCAAAAGLLMAWALFSQVDRVFAQQIDGGDSSYPDDFFDSGEYAPACGGSGSYCEPAPSRTLSGWVGAEYLHWRLSGDDLPPLVTDSPATTPLAEAGVLGNPDTRILSGDETVGNDWRSGWRIYAGVWLDCCWALGGDYFNAGDDDYDFRAGNDPDRIVARPFFNTNTGVPSRELVSVPNELEGTVDVAWSDEFEGAGLTLYRCISRCGDPCGCGPTHSVSFISGYRYYGYDSELGITENLEILPGNTTSTLVVGTQIFVQDSFLARNEFHGGEIGLQGCYQSSWWWVDGLAKLAIGSNRRTVIIDGQTTFDIPGQGVQTFEGGLLASSETNIGRYTDDTVIGIPEFRVGVGAMLTKSVSLRAGYNVIIWNDVARAGSHLPPGLRVDTDNIPPVIPGGGPDPRFPGIQDSTLVAHGFNLAIEWAY
jgi:hypothetical protein